MTYQLVEHVAAEVEHLELEHEGEAGGQVLEHVLAQLQTLQVRQAETQQ